MIGHDQVMLSDLLGINMKAAYDKALHNAVWFQSEARPKKVCELRCLLLCKMLSLNLHRLCSEVQYPPALESSAGLRVMKALRRFSPLSDEQ